MKNTIKSVMIGGSLLAAVPASAEIEAEAYAGYHSIYEFRGVDLGDDLFDAGVELSYELSDGTALTGGFWFADNDALDEVDFYVGLTKTIGAFDVSAGYTFYSVYGSGGAPEWNTHEVYLGASHELSCGLGLSLTYFEDIDEIDGGYLEFEAGKSYELSECVGLDLAAGAAWSFDYNGDVNGGALDGFNHWFASVALPWELMDGVTLTPYIKYVGAGSDLNNDFDATASDDLFYGGVSLSVGF